MGIQLEIKGSIFRDIYEYKNDIIYFKTLLLGKWVSGYKINNIYTPIDESLIATIPRLSWESIDNVLDKIYNLGKWEVRDISGDKRVEIINKIADLMEEQKEDFVNVLMIDVGKTRKQALGEVNASIDRMRKVELDLRKIFGEYIPGDWSSHTLESEGILKKEPYGVVLGIIPFNYPLFDTVNKFVYSTVAGNAFLVKPPSTDPLVVLLFANLVEEAGFPKNGFSVLTIPGKESDRLVADRRINVISFTGSSKTGVRILGKAGIKQFIMEMGGGDPAIILNDADIELAIDKVATGIVSFSSQRCDAIKLVLVENDVYNDIKKGLVRKLASVKVGDPRNDVDMGPLISSTAVDKMIEAVKDAIEKGGLILYGGERLGSTYVQPTLIEVTNKEQLKKMKAYRDEIFAPLALITKIDSVDEAIELANDRSYGLDAAIFGKDIVKIRRLIRYLEVGAIYINEYPRHGIGYYPFGGRKDSGIGREGIGYSIEYVTALKTIIYNYRGKGIWEYV